MNGLGNERFNESLGYARVIDESDREPMMAGKEVVFTFRIRFLFHCRADKRSKLNPF